MVFAFNHEEAARSFRRASELDPQSAMTFWGLALALGPCINLDVDPPHEQAAYEDVQKALSHAPGATESERAYIQALAKRYSSDSKIDLRKLDAEYANAMRELSHRLAIAGVYVGCPLSVFSVVTAIVGNGRSRVITWLAGGSLAVVWSIAFFYA